MRQWIGVGLIIVGLGVASPGVATEKKVYEKLETFSKVLSYVEANYIEEVSSETLVENAIRGMLSDLDPHTLYMSPEVYREMQVDTAGEFGGVGIEISMKDNQLVVVSPIEESPADRAGIKPGDKIVKIEGESTKDMSLTEAIQRIRGPRGTILKLTLERKEEPGKIYEVGLKRERIELKSVDSEFLDEGYGYIRLRSFQESTDQELKNHFDKLQKKNKGKPLFGLMLDLRNNPGGLLEQAIRVADAFLDSGIIVSTIGRKGSFQEVKMAHEAGTFPDIPMVTLVNEGTASAAEIVAGALQDHRRSVILGVPTFGKGSVQTIIDLEDGAGLKLTIARYYTPLGRSIQALGILPDIFISQKPPVEDSQQVREKDLSRHLESVSHGKEKEKDTVVLEGDFQKARALEYLKTWEVFRTTVGQAKPSK